MNELTRRFSIAGDRVGHTDEFRQLAESFGCQVTTKTTRRQIEMTAKGENAQVIVGALALIEAAKAAALN
jgi:hypothetical protein